MVPRLRSATSRIAARYVARNAIAREDLPSVGSVRTWVVTRDDGYEVVYPMNLARAVPLLAESVGSHRAPGLQVNEVSQAYVFGDAAVALTSDGRLVWESVQGRKNTLRKALWHAPLRAIAVTAGARRPRFRGTQSGRREPHPTMFLHGRQAGGYYHFTLDYLPKLRAVEYYEAETGEQVDLVVPPDGASPSSYVRQSLDAIGFGSRRIREWSGGPERFDRLIVATHRTNSTTAWDASASDLLWLRDRARQYSRISGAVEAGGLVYVSRADASRRRVVNEDDVMGALEELGFRSYTLTNMPVRDQIALFASARVVVGPHGAGLTNMVYAPSSATLVEFLPEVFPKPVYQILTSQMRQTYAVLLCESERTPSGPLINSPLRVSVPDLIAILKSVLALR